MMFETEQLGGLTDGTAGVPESAFDYGSFAGLGMLFQREPLPRAFRRQLLGLIALKGFEKDFGTGNQAASGRRILGIAEEPNRRAVDGYQFLRGNFFAQFFNDVEFRAACALEVASGLSGIDGALEEDSGPAIVAQSGERHALSGQSF